MGFTHNDYDVGWICTLSEELTAATFMLDQTHPSLTKPLQDDNTYTLGSIGKYNVVIACLPQGKIGANAAAVVATQMASAFPSLRFSLMVGTGGGIPHKDKVRLGDVVVGIPFGQHPGVIQWDFGKTEAGGKFRRTGALDNPPAALLTALTKLSTTHEIKRSKIQEYLDEMKKKNPKLAPRYLRSNSLKDELFEEHCHHVQRNDGVIRDTPEHKDGESESDGEEDSCKNCDKTKVIQREPRDMCVHYGLIASGNQVIKDASLRDKINQDLGGNILCVEMETAGVLSSIRCIAIRGICNYADSHKNKSWTRHAAAVAAAVAKELLSETEIWEGRQRGC